MICSFCLQCADYLAGSAAIIHMCTRTPVKLAWDSHFVGHLRAVNNNVLDMYHLKSLHALRQCDTKKFVREDDGTITQTFEMELPHWSPPGTATFTSKGYDKVILATGWKFINIDMFDATCKPGKTFISSPIGGAISALTRLTFVWLI